MTLAWKLEMAFGVVSSTPLPSSWSAASWTDLTPDVRASADVVAFWGQRNCNPTDRIAQPGTLQFVLDNTFGLGGYGLGYYSPDSANKHVQFGLGIPIRVSISRDNWATAVYNIYYITDIQPVAGRYRERSVAITATDYIGWLVNQYTSAITVQTGKKTDALLPVLINLCSSLPLHTSYSAGLDTLAYAFHDVTDKTSILNAAQRLIQSDLGYLYREVDTTDGETLKYQTRDDRLTAALFTSFDDSMRDLTIQHSEQNIFNYVKVKTHPVSVGTVAEVMFTLQREQQLNPGQILAITANYRDPAAGGQQIRLDPGTEVAPVPDIGAGGDYRMSSTPGGTGHDLNGDLDITGTPIAWHADNAVVTLHNTGASIGYINKFQLRGQIIRLYDAVESISKTSDGSLAAYGEHDLSFDMPYQDNPYTGKSFADYLLTKWGLPATNVESVSFCANSNVQNSGPLFDVSGAPILDVAGDPIIAGMLLEDVMIDARIGDAIGVKETVTGVDATFWITGIEWTIKAGSTFYCRLFTERAVGGTCWSLGETGFSELGVTTVLGL